MNKYIYTLMIKETATLLSRAEDGENTIAPVASNAAVDVMQLTYNNF